MPRPAWQRRHRLLLVCAALAAAAVALGAQAGHALRHVELDLTDVHFALRGQSAPPDELLVVGIDAATFGELQERWPLRRRLHARVIDRLRAGGARVIGYDVQFTEPTTVTDDNALIEAIDRAGNVVLSATEVDAQGRTNVLGGEEVLRDVGARAANTNMKADADGVYRRLRRSIEGLDTFAVVIAEQASGGRRGAAGLGPDGAPIDFRGPPGTIATVSFSDVLAGRVPAARIRDRIVIVGAVAPSLQDVHATAVSRDEPMPGAELQANAVWTALHGLPLEDAPGRLDLPLIVLLSVAVPLAALRLRGWRLPVLGIVLAAVYAGATHAAFGAGLVLPLAAPLLGLALGTGSAIALDYLFEAFERDRTREVFGRFVPEAVVDDVLARTDERRWLGGEHRVATVLFCDLRGFTAFSEHLPAAQVIEVVNRYLGEMSDAILEAGGTLVAYMGDGIMAVFGAPLEQPDHADRALRAAREMMGPRLARFNAWLAEQGLERRFRMGIGLNSGDVMSGTVGSEQRMEYTALGDTTNTASRLEGLTKQFPHMLLLSAATRALLRERPDDLVCLGPHEIRGHEQPLELWSVPDPPGSPAPPASAPRRAGAPA